MLVSITTIPAAANIGVALAMGNPSEAGKSLSILLVNLVGLLAGGVLTLLGTRVWARRIEAGQAIIRPQAKARPLTGRPYRWLGEGRRAFPASARGPGQQG